MSLKVRSSVTGTHSAAPCEAVPAREVGPLRSASAFSSAWSRKAVSLQAASAISLARSVRSTSSCSTHHQQSSSLGSASPSVTEATIAAACG